MQLLLTINKPKLPATMLVIDGFVTQEEAHNYGADWFNAQHWGEREYCSFFILPEGQK